jgi:hypothetical protein
MVPTSIRFCCGRKRRTYVVYRKPGGIIGDGFGCWVGAVETPFVLRYWSKLEDEAKGCYGC